MSVQATSRRNGTAGWTGGQYSLIRALAGLTFAFGLARALLGPPPPGIGVSLWPPEAVFAACSTLGLLASLAFALGWRDKLAAVVLAASLANWLGMDFRALGAGGAWAVAFLLVHLLVPRAPFGSADALGREDPPGNWRMPALGRAAAWLLLAAGSALSAWAAAAGGTSRVTVLFAALPFPQTRGPDLALSCLALALCAAGLVRWLRPWAWLALLALTCLLGAVHGSAPIGPLLLLALAFEPRWLAPRVLPQGSFLFYDGTCGLCHAAVRFVLAEETETGPLRFAPLGGETFRHVLSENARRRLPDSLVLFEPGAPPRLRSAAVIRLLGHCGGLWRLLAFAGRFIPAVLRDPVYDTLARVRYRLLPRPRDWCPVAAEHLRARFDR